MSDHLLLIDKEGPDFWKAGETIIVNSDLIFPLFD